MGRAPVRGVALALGVVALLIATTAGAALASSPNPRSSSHPTQGTDAITVTVGSALQFTLSGNYVTPGDTVDLTLVQTGTVVHTFTLSSVRNYTLNSNVNTSAQVNQFFAAHPPLVNVTFPSTPGQVTASFTAPPLGKYQFLCLIDSHFQGGMWGILGSGVQVNVVAPYTGPGAPVFIITGVLVGLVVLAIVLGFVVGRRRGSADEMPPERLGYSEPSEPPSPPEPLKSRSIR